MRTRLFQTLFLSGSLLSALILSAQPIIPNGGFENWEMNDIGVTDPVSWWTDNQEVETSVTPDSTALEGDLCMMITTYDTGIGEYGNAEILVPITELPTSLKFAAKYETMDMGTVFVSYSLQDQGNLVGSGYWSPNDNESPNWIPIDLPIEDPGVPVTDIFIHVGAAVGDLAFGSATLWVDAMFFETVLSTDDGPPAHFDIFPNPATDRLVIDYGGMENEVDRIRIVDMSGHLVLDRAASTLVDVSALPTGRYELEVVDKEGAAVMRKGVVVE